MVNKGLTIFLERNYLLSPRQFSFRRGKCPEDAVTLLTEILVYHHDEGRCCTGVFLDLGKAFDTVTIPILLRKLEAFCIRMTTLHWFTSYLANRK